MNTLSKDIDSDWQVVGELDELLAQIAEDLHTDPTQPDGPARDKDIEDTFIFLKKNYKSKLNKLILEFIKDLVGEEVKPHPEPKLGIDTPTYLTANEDARNAYRKELLELAKEKLNG